MASPVATDLPAVPIEGCPHCKRPPCPYHSQPKAPSRPTFEAAVEKLCASYGYQDYAIVALRADGTDETFCWGAGELEAERLDNRRRAADLILQMGLLLDAIRAFCRQHLQLAKPAPGSRPAPG